MIIRGKEYHVKANIQACIFFAEGGSSLTKVDIDGVSNQMHKKEGERGKQSRLLT